MKEMSKERSYEVMNTALTDSIEQSLTASPALEEVYGNY